MTRQALHDFHRTLAVIGHWCELNGARYDVPGTWDAQLTVLREWFQGKPWTDNGWPLWIAAVMAASGHCPPDPLGCLGAYEVLRLSGAWARQGKRIRAALLDGRLPKIWVDRLENFTWPELRGFPPERPMPPVYVPSLELDHWTADLRANIYHPSHLVMWSRCGFQGFYRYEEGLIRPPSAPSIRGRTGHHTIRLDLEHKVATWELLPDDAITDYALDYFKRAWSDGVRLTDDEKDHGIQTIRGHYLDQSVRAALHHHRTLAPRIFPTHLERRFRLTVPNRPYQLGGTVDIWEPRRIRDTKITEKAYSQSDVDGSVQLTTYALAARVLDGQNPDAVSLDTLRVTSSDVVTKILTSSRSDQDFEALFLRTDVVHRQRELGVYQPAPPDSWWCSEKWCGYWDICPHGRRGRLRRQWTGV